MITFADEYKYIERVSALVGLLNALVLTFPRELAIRYVISGIRASSVLGITFSRLSLSSRRGSVVATLARALLLGLKVNSADHHLTTRDSERENNKRI